MGNNKGMKNIFRNMAYGMLKRIVPEIEILKRDIDVDIITNVFSNSHKGEPVKLFAPYQVLDSQIGDYTYVSRNSIIKNTKIGKFCSIGPNLVSGWGMHPTNGLSNAPMFYSSENLSNGMSLSPDVKFKEEQEIRIGNDVFIGANVTILDGVKIGNGAIIGAGAVVSKNIPDYAVAVGCPIKIIRYKFESDKIEALQGIKWWDFKSKEELQLVEKYFFDIDSFIQSTK